MFPRWGGIFDPDGLKLQVDRLTNLSTRPGFWDEREKAEKLMRERAKAEATLNSFRKVESNINELDELLTMAADEADQDMIDEVVAQLPELTAQVRELELKRMLSDDDDHDAVLSINSGAGGTDAEDWAQLLKRMYTRWCDRKGLKYSVMSETATEYGLSSCDLLVKGQYAYGFLRAESGVHRLIRISKFSGRRETSFAGVTVTPNLDDVTEDSIVLKDEELEITVMRSGGAGGQHVNRTESAVRIKHIPTGIAVRCDQERSQHQNKDLAKQRLKGLLFEKERREAEAAFEDAFLSDQGEISFGSQARTYTLQPYTMVKDERTEHKVGNANGVLDGDIDSFIETYLMYAADKKKELEGENKN